MSGLSIYEHSIVSLAAFAHTSNRRSLFLGIVSNGAVYVAVAVVVVVVLLLVVVVVVLVLVLVLVLVVVVLLLLLLLVMMVLSRYIIHNDVTSPLSAGTLSRSPTPNSLLRSRYQLTTPHFLVLFPSQPGQNEFKNAALEVVTYVCDLSSDDGRSLASLRQEFVSARRFAQCLIAVHDNLARPDASGAMAHWQSVQVMAVDVISSAFAENNCWCFICN